MNRVCHVRGDAGRCGARTQERIAIADQLLEDARQYGASRTRDTVTVDLLVIEQRDHADRRRNVLTVVLQSLC